MPATPTSSRPGSTGPTRSSTARSSRSPSSGAIPIVLGGDHSITWPSATAVAEVRRPGSIGIVHFDAHADTAADDWGVLAGHGTPMRRLIESGAVKGRNFVQVGLRGYWPPVETFEWMQEQGLRYHFMREIEERGAEAVIAQAIDEALDGPDYVYLSLDIDVVDPGMAPGTGTPEPGGMLTPRGPAGDPPDRRRRSISPGWTSSRSRRRTTTPETTAMIANRAALEAISALAVRRAAGTPVRWAGVDFPADRFPPGRASVTATRADRGMLDRPDAATAAALARLYDLDLADDPGDLDLYLALADRADGPILELAVGTGRLAIPLAEAGHVVTGVDIDPAMLARARERARGQRRRGPPDARRGGHRRAAAAGRPAVRPRVHRAQLAPRAADPGRPASRAPRARRPPRPGGLAVVDVWLPDADGPRPVRRPDQPRVAAPRPRDRGDRDQGRLRPARRRDAPA